MDQREPGHAPVAAEGFDELLRRHRLAAELTQETLAERAGLSMHGIQRLESGRSHPHRDTVQRLALALALPPDDQLQFSAAGRPAPRRSFARVQRANQPHATERHNLPTSLSSFI